ncbi:Sensor histidine kinase RcsC [subsurface metagenome]
MKLKEKQLDFVKEIDPDVPMFLNLDELRIRQVLLNLISNAVKYTDSGYVKINVKVNKKYDNKIDLSLSVIDTGIGISEKNQKFIFDSFQQVEEQETRKFGGTGLGLSISKRLVELMGGEIVIKSELNKGSVFTILIKEVSITEQDIEQKDKYELKPERIEFEHSRILIVDDIENNRKVIKVFLQDYDFDILEAENGQQALYILKEIKPDLVFMDIKMPGLDGYQVIKIIRKEKTLKDIPVIAITALAFKKVDKDIIDMGFDGYMIKPVQQVEILNELTKFIKYKEVVIKKETKQTRDIILSESDFEKLPAIIEKIEKNIMPVWIPISKRQTIQKTKQFYEKLKELDELFFFKPISYYCDNLSNAINTFNIDNINRLVLEFPYLISKFKNIINEKKQCGK